MGQAFKFLHASDIHLDQALRGLAEVPAPLKTTLANAPYQVAENIFDLAIAEKVDFVLLAGDVVDLDAAGPRAATFLQKQFERLQARGIQVFWCGGDVDQPDRWPGVSQLPNNVVTFSSMAFERRDVTRDGLTIATVFGTGFFASRSELGTVAVKPNDPFPLALAHGEFETSEFEGDIRYWAMGGVHRGSIQELEATTVVYPGTPQSRSRSETGVHTCAVVHVDATGKVRVDTVAVDVVRWLPQTLAFAESASDEEIKNLFADRGLKVVADSPEQLALVDWQLTTSGPIDPRFRQGRWREDMLRWLRTEFGSSTTGLWSIDIALESERALPAKWLEEETMLGDYLRALQELQTDRESTIQFSAYLPTKQPDERLTDLTRLDEASYPRIMREAALIGVERLGLWTEDED